MWEYSLHKLTENQLVVLKFPVYQEDKSRCKKKVVSGGVIEEVSEGFGKSFHLRLMSSMEKRIAISKSHFLETVWSVVRAWLLFDVAIISYPRLFWCSKRPSFRNRNCVRYNLNAIVNPSCFASVDVGSPIKSVSNFRWYSRSFICIYSCCSSKSKYFFLNIFPTLHFQSRRTIFSMKPKIQYQKTRWVAQSTIPVFYFHLPWYCLH